MNKRTIIIGIRGIVSKLWRLFSLAKLGLLDSLVGNPKVPFRNAALAKVGMLPAEVVSISSVAALGQTYELAAASQFSIYSPSFPGAPAKRHEGLFHKLRAYSLDGVIASAYSSGFARNNQLLLPSHIITNRHRISTAQGGVFRDVGGTACVATTAELNLDSGILVGGAGAFNWYHFVVECLPKAFLAQRLSSEYDGVPLIVPEECKTVGSFSDAIAAVAKGRPLVYLSHRQRARFRKLIVFDEVSCGPFNMVSGEWPRVTDYFQHDAELKTFFSDFRREIISGPRPSHMRRLFLARSGSRREYNQDELMEISQKYGFESVYPENLTLTAQAELYSGASMIIGPSGAAWVGLTLCSQPIAGLSWLPLAYSEFCSYSTLAHLLGHNLSFVEAKPERELRSTGDAYTGNYSVCPGEFEDELRNILNRTSS